MYVDIHTAMFTQLCLNIAYRCSATSTAVESENAEQAAKLSWEAQKTLGQLAWVELCAAVIKELLLAKLFSFKSSSTTFAQAAVIYIIVQRSVSYLD